MNAQKAEEKKRKRNGLIVTISVHAVAIVIFCLFGFDVVDPKAVGFDVEWAIEGVQDAGGEDNLENTSEKIANDNNPPTSSSSSKASAQEDEQLITNDASDVAVKNSPTKTTTPPKDVTINDTEKNNPNETKEVKKEDSEMKRILDGLSGKLTSEKGPNNPSDGKGDGKKTGIEGEENGQGTASSGKGGEGGNRWVVDGRVPIKISSKEHDCKETGKVEVYIKINREGKVISAVDRGGTTQNECVIKIALEQAKAIKYNTSSTYNEGTIIIDLGYK